MGSGVGGLFIVSLRERSCDYLIRDNENRYLFLRWTSRRGRFGVLESLPTFDLIFSVNFRSILFQFSLSSLPSMIYTIPSSRGFSTVR